MLELTGLYKDGEDHRKKNVDENTLENVKSLMTFRLKKKDCL
ncbi:MAG: hypothetical protein ACLRMZ_28490 [Blautia marasmi]